MAHTIHVDVVSAEASIFEGEAEFVALPGEAGEFFGSFWIAARGATKRMT